MDGMRALKAVTIFMGVLIVLGTGLLIAVIVHRSTTPTPPPGPVALRLDEPAGTRIAGVAGAADRLAVLLLGGGEDRVVLVDPRSGAVTGRIRLGH